MISSLKVSLLALVLALIAVLTVAPSADAASNHVYNGNNAAAYADRYSCNITDCSNSNFRRITDDCTNFVSQSVNAGGFTATQLWRPYSQDWAYVLSLFTVFRTWGWANLVSQYSGSGLAAAYTSAIRGDILMYDWGRGTKSFSHVAILAGWGARSTLYSKDGAGDYVDQHNTDRYHSPWNYGYLHPDSSIDRAHMRVWVLRPTHQVA
jgi:hypothetical protein